MSTIIYIIAALISPEDIGFTGPSSADNVMQNILFQVYFWLGLVAVAMIVYGGFLYTTSNGDPGKIKKAKDSILYSLIGIVVVLTAFVITRFVVQGVS